MYIRWEYQIKKLQKIQLCHLLLEHIVNMCLSRFNILRQILKRKNKYILLKCRLINHSHNLFTVTNPCHHKKLNFNKNICKSFEQILHFARVISSSFPVHRPTFYRVFCHRWTSLRFMFSTFFFAFWWNFDKVFMQKKISAFTIISYFI